MSKRKIRDDDASNRSVKVAKTTKDYAGNKIVAPNG
jgi:hypothetical protein